MASQPRYGLNKSNTKRDISPSSLSRRRVL
jgi:hypothetical protein